MRYSERQGARRANDCSAVGRWRSCSVKEKKREGFIALGLSVHRACGTVPPLESCDDDVVCAESAERPCSSLVQALFRPTGLGGRRRPCGSLVFSAHRGVSQRGECGTSAATTSCGLVKADGCDSAEPALAADASSSARAASKGDVESTETTLLSERSWWWRSSS